MRCVLICLFSLSMSACATSGGSAATAEAAKVSCCAQAKADGKACEGCAAKKAAAAPAAQKDCCAAAAAGGQPCAACADKKTKMNCCAEAKAAGKPCAACATKKAPADEG